MIDITNVLLVILISLLGYIGNKFYNKLEELGTTIQNILLSDMSHTKDIKQLTADRDDHEKRITNLETE